MTFPWTHHDLPMTSPFPSLFATYRHVSQRFATFRHVSPRFRPGPLAKTLLRAVGPELIMTRWGWFNQQRWWFNHQKAQIVVEPSRMVGRLSQIGFTRQWWYQFKWLLDGDIVGKSGKYLKVDWDILFEFHHHLKLAGFKHVVWYLEISKATTLWGHDRIFWCWEW